MISPWIYVATIISIIICFVLPLGYMTVLEIKRKRILRPYWMGALCFFLAEMIVLLPVLNMLRNQGGWYVNLQEGNPVLYALFLAFMTALFEGAARVLFIKFLLKNSNRHIDAVSMGVGQGLLAVLMTGLTLVGMIFYYIAVNGGVLGEVSGLEGEALAQMEQELLRLRAADLIFLGIEQICSICMQIGYAVMTYKAVKGNKWVLLPVVVLWQMVPNILAATMSFADGSTNYVLEVLYIVLAAAGIFYAWFERNSDVWGENVDVAFGKPSSAKTSGKSLKEIMNQMSK